MIRVPKPLLVAVALFAVTGVAILAQQQGRLLKASVGLEYGGETPDSALRGELIPMSFNIRRESNFPESQPVDIVLEFEPELEVIERASSFGNFFPDSRIISGQTVTWRGLKFAGWSENFMQISFFTRLREDAEVGKTVHIYATISSNGDTLSRWKIPVKVLGGRGDLPESGLTSVTVRPDKTTVKRGDKITYRITLQNEGDLTIEDTMATVAHSKHHSIIKQSLKPKYFTNDVPNGIQLHDLRLPPHRELSFTLQTKVATTPPDGTTLTLTVKAGGQPEHIKTASAKVKVKGGLLGGLPQETIVRLFRQVYGRVPNAAEASYWLQRSREKKTATALLGAMQAAKAGGR